MDGPKVTMEAAQPMWTARDRTQTKLPIFPDMPLGAIKAPSNEYLWFGPGSMGKRETEGTYVFHGSLSSFQPCDFPQPTMHTGSIQPSPDGNDFDRDYAGGGPVYCVAPNGALTGVFDGHAPIIVLYHGEYHFFGTKLGQFGGSGLAISRNGGRTFSKLGAILLPHEPKEQCGEEHRNAYADGSLVEADEAGNPIEERGKRDGNQLENRNSTNIRSKETDSRERREPEVYWYAIYTDPLGIKGRAGFSVARVKRSDAIAALKRNQSPQFNKYFEGKWTESGVGGNSSPVVLEPDHYIATPQVHYSQYLRKFVLVYQQDQNSVWLRTSSNLIDWSQPTLLHRVAAVDEATGVKKKLFYPSIVGFGNDPLDIGQRFYLYFVTGPVSEQMNVWKSGALLHKVVTFAD
ncbi:MAG TPA: hypothetical protein V6C89_15320 [Drouetiella sp.]